MTNPKIIIDTNVLVSASILQNIAELETEIKHEFYDQSIQLFSLFNTPVSNKAGYLVPKVKSESFIVLAKAVKSVFVPSTLVNARRKEIFYNDAVAIINASEHKMRKLMGLLEYLELEESKIQTNLAAVRNMSSDLMNEWRKKYQKYNWRVQETKVRSKPIVTEKHWKLDQKKEVVHAHKKQIDRESRQLYRFQRKHPNLADERILAESITLKTLLEKTEVISSFMIASCDSGFFSPYIGSDGISNTVTTEIHTRFGIVCDYPRAVFFMAGGK